MCLVCVCRLREVELRQAAESGQLQRSLVEEQGRRQLAEQALEQLRGEVAIGLDDDVIGSSDQTPAPAHGEPKTAGKGGQAAVTLLY